MRYLRDLWNGQEAASFGPLELLRGSTEGLRLEPARFHASCTLLEQPITPEFCASWRDEQ